MVGDNIYLDRKFLMAVSISFLSPLLGLIYAIYNIEKLWSYKGLILITLLISLIGIYWFPWGDTQSHFSFYKTNLFDYDLIPKYKTIFIYDYIISIVAGLCGNFVWGYFIWLFVPLLFLLLSIRSKTDRVSFFYISFLLLSIGVRNYLDLNRSTAAALLFLAGLLLFDKRKILSITLFVFASTLHESVSYLVVVTFMLYIMDKIFDRFIYNYNYYIAVALIIFSTVILTRFSFLLSSRTIDAYLSDGSFGTGTGVGSTAMFLMGRINQVCLAVLFVFMTQKRKYIQNHLLLSMFFGSCFIVFCGISFWTISERFTNYALISGAILLIVEHKNVLEDNFKINLLLKICLSLFLCRSLLLLSLMFSARVVHNSASFDNAKEFAIVSHTLYVPLPALLDIDTFGFSDANYLKLYKRAGRRY